MSEVTKAFGGCGMDPGSQQGGRRLPASFLLTAGSKRQKPEPGAAGSAKGGLPDQSGIAASLHAGATTVDAPPAQATEVDLGPARLEPQPNGFNASAPAKPAGTRKLPGSFTSQASRAPVVAGPAAQARPPVPVNQEDTQACGTSYRSPVCQIQTCADLMMTR